VVGRKNGFSTSERCLDGLEKFITKISRDSDLGNSIAVLCVAPVNLKPENYIGVLGDSGYIETLAQGMSDSWVRTGRGGLADCLVEKTENISRRHPILYVFL